MTQASAWINGVVVVALALFLSFAAILWQFGFFNFDGTDNSAKIVAAALALVGGLFGSLVTVVTVLVKLSVDQRNADLNAQAQKRLELESERNAALQEEAESRLKMEAAIQAVKLLSGESGKEVPVTQRAAVLFTLVKLDLLDLALTMLANMLERRKIDGSSASWVLSAALESGSSTYQMEAGTILENYPGSFIIDRKNHSRIDLPRAIDCHWDPQLPVVTREALFEFLTSTLLSRTYSQWDKGFFNALIVTLCEAWKQEEMTGHENLRSGIAGVMNSVLQKYEAGYVIYPPGGAIQIDDIKLAVKKRKEDANFYTYDKYMLYIHLAGKWLEDEPYDLAIPGASEPGETDTLKT